MFLIITPKYKELYRKNAKPFFYFQPTKLVLFSHKVVIVILEINIFSLHAMDSRCTLSIYFCSVDKPYSNVIHLLGVLCLNPPPIRSLTPLSIFFNSNIYSHISNFNSSASQICSHISNFNFHLVKYICIYLTLILQLVRCVAIYLTLILQLVRYIAIYLTLIFTQLNIQPYI